MSLLLATLVLLFSVDRCAKALVFRRQLVGDRRSIAPFLTILPVRNERPRCWPSGSPIVWSLSFGLALAAALLLVALDSHSSAPMAVGLGAALGGALGNLYDRIRHGVILDFLHVGVGGIFNLADVSLVLGLALVLASHIDVATSFLARG